VTYNDIESVVVPGVSTATLEGGVPTSINATSPWAGMRFSGPELPRINYDSNNGRAYCYVYGYSGHAFQSVQWEAAAIVKVDLCTLAVARHKSGDASAVLKAPVSLWYRSNWYPTEPVFIAAPNPKSEDDGILLLDAYDGEARVSKLVVLNATTLAEVAIVESPVRVPWPLHGQFFPTPV